MVSLTDAEIQYNACRIRYERLSKDPIATEAEVMDAYLDMLEACDELQRIADWEAENNAEV